MKSPTHKLLDDIERFLKRTQIFPSKFGLMALGDPNLVQDMRKGRELRHSTVVRVRRMMRAVYGTAEEAAEDVR